MGNFARSATCSAARTTLEPISWPRRARPFYPMVLTADALLCGKFAGLMQRHRVSVRILRRLS